MRSLKLNKFERVAGLFILCAVGGVLFTAVSVAIKKGWFEPRVRYYSTFDSAEGLHAGASVKMAGLNAGSVESVELIEQNKVRVTYTILEKFSEKIRQDSVAQLIRPFVIGDRVLDITVGSVDAVVLKEDSEIKAENTVDIMTILSGKKMNHAIAQFSSAIESMQILMQAFTDRERIQSIVRMFDRLDPLLVNLNKMSEEIVKTTKLLNKDESLREVLKNAALLTQELNKIVPVLNAENPKMGKDMALMMASLAKMTQEMEVVMSDPQGAGQGGIRRAAEALNEATILLKALQKSFFLRSSVQEVKEEESQRLPASSN